MGGPEGPAWRRFLWLWLLAASLVAAVGSGLMRPVGLLWVAGLSVALQAFLAPKAGWVSRTLATVALLVLAGLVGTAIWLHRRQAAPADTAPLSPDESRRLAGLLRDNEG